jgi:phenylacetate-CoA ligase
MTIVRGVNVFPSAIENVMREFPEIDEFRVEVSAQNAMSELKLILESHANDIAAHELAERVRQRVRECIGLRPQVETVAPGSLPRFELKAKRFFKV